MRKNARLKSENLGIGSGTKVYLVALKFREPLEYVSFLIYIIGMLILAPSTQQV